MSSSFRSRISNMAVMVGAACTVLLVVRNIVMVALNVRNVALSSSVVANSSRRAFLDDTTSKVMHVTTTKSQCHVTRNRTNQHGSWLGNTWVPPPGWKYYSAVDLRYYYKDKRILWIGDSTSRRAAFTFYASLTSENEHPSVDELDHPSVIDKGKIIRGDPGNRTVFEDTVSTNICSSLNITKKTEKYYIPLCRSMPASGVGSLLILQDVVCFSKLAWFFIQQMKEQSHLAEKVDIIVINLGIWEMRFPKVCQKASKTDKPLSTRLEGTVDVVEMFQKATGKTIVWRTTGFLDVPTADHPKSEGSRTMNRQLMDRIDSYRKNDTACDNSQRLTYVDWGGAIEPRVFGADRIKGDMMAHHGLEPRTVLIQMITNHLREEGVE